MNRSSTSGKRIGIVLALIGVLSTVGLSPASAASVPSATASSSSCSGVAANRGSGGTVPLNNIWSAPFIRQPFTQWGDNNDYFPVYGGTVEYGFMWNVTGSAWMTAENNPYYANSPFEWFSMKIPSGSSATTLPYTMAYNDDIRFFLKSPGIAASKLQVTITASSPFWSNYAQPLASCTYTIDGGASGWMPSPTLAIPNAMGSVGFQMLSISFKVSGGGSWQVDDIMQDPVRIRF